jgi:UDPglucose 6-dehydrogenase
MSVSVVGLGYVGVTMAVCLADRGIPVFGVDIDSKRIDFLRNGRPRFYEPEIEERLKRNLKKKRLTFTGDFAQAVKSSRITFITVGTPSNPDGSINLDQVKSAAATIGFALKKKSSYHLIVLRSTVTPGTTEEVVRPTLESTSGKRCGQDFGLCVNPEFLSEGRAVQGMLNPDRLVIGECDKKSGNRVMSFYNEFYSGRMPRFLRTSPINAEFVKYTNNAFLATKVSFINSIANLCERVQGADVEVVARGIGLDPRIGPHFLRAGLGWGGSCLPKDLRALLAYAEDLECDLPVIRASLELNESQPLRAVELAKRLIGPLKNKRIAVLGLSFKPETDDIREAVSIKIVNCLLDECAHVSVYDPKVPRNILSNDVSYSSNAKDCVQGADCCIVATEWDEFKDLTPDDFIERMRTPSLIDGRRIYSPEQYRSRIKYAAIGLG